MGFLIQPASAVKYSYFSTSILPSSLSEPEYCLKVLWSWGLWPCSSPALLSHSSPASILPSTVQVHCALESLPWFSTMEVSLKETTALSLTVLSWLKPPDITPFRIHVNFWTTLSCSRIWVPPASDYYSSYYKDLSFYLKQDSLKGQSVLRSSLWN